jgi:hypothetical protein
LSFSSERPAIGACGVDQSTSRMTPMTSSPVYKTGISR